MEEAGRKLFETSLSIFFVISYEAFSVLKLKVKGKKMPLGFKRGIGEIRAPRGLRVHPGYPPCNVPRLWSVFRCGESNV